MTITECLKQYPVRVSSGWRWLVWAEERGFWQVYEEVRYAKKSKILYEGPSEEAAVEVLTRDE